MYIYTLDAMIRPWLMLACNILYSIAASYSLSVFWSGWVVKHNLIDSLNNFLTIIQQALFLYSLFYFFFGSDIYLSASIKEFNVLLIYIMCSQQVDSNLSAQVDFVNVDEFEPAFALIPSYGDYDYKELVFFLY